MPIYDIQQRGLKFPQIGTIRKGVRMPVIDKNTGKPKKRNGEIMTYPKEVNYFVFHVDPKAQDAVERIYSAYGTKEIDALRCFLAYPDAMSNFDYWLEAYTASQLVARSDGRVVTYLRDVTSAEVLVRESHVCAHSSNPKSAAGQLVQEIPIGGELLYVEGMVVANAKTSGDAITFKAVGRLHVVIPEVKRPVTFTVITGAYWYDIPSIKSAVELVDVVSRYSDPVRPANTIPVILRRKAVEVPYVGEDGQRHVKVQHPIEMEVAADVFGGLLEAYADTPIAFQLQAPQSPQNYPALASGEYDYDSEIVDEPIEDEPFIPSEPSDPEPVSRNQPQEVNTTGERMWSVAQRNALIDNGLAPNDFGAKGMLNLSNLPEDVDENTIVDWGRQYRSVRHHPVQKGDYKAQEAAEFANEWYEVLVETSI